MKRFIPIIISFWLAFSAWATQVNLVADPDNWFTPQPHDTLFINEPGKYMLKITQIGKYHIEQTIKDTVELNLQANNIIDEKVRNGQPSTDTLQVSFKNIRAGRRVKKGDDYLINFIKDTCNLSIALYGDCRLTDISSIGHKPSFIYVSGSSPTFKCFVYDSFTCARRINSAQIYGIETRLSNADSLHYYFNPLGKLSTGGIYNNEGHIIINDSRIVENMVVSSAGASTTLNDSYFEANDYSWHNSILMSRGKLYIENSTIKSTNDLTLIDSSDTIFINQSPGKTTHIDAVIGSKRNPLNETKYSRVIVNNASYIREITAMTDVYNANIDILCPSPLVKDTLTNADINVYGGKIGLLTNNVYMCEHLNQTISKMGKRTINVYNSELTNSSAPIRLGHYCLMDVRSVNYLCYNDTLNLYQGKITVPAKKELIRIYDNTFIRIHHKNDPSRYTSIQYHPKDKLKNWSSIELRGGTTNGDSTHWNIGDVEQIGIKSSSTSLYGATHQPLRIVYRNSQSITDSLVVGVHKDSTHFIKNNIKNYDIVDIYTASQRTIHYVHTLDETWQNKDSTYREGFGKQSLPKVIYAGKTFKGWYTEPEGGIKVDSISHLQMGDVTLYTQWGPGQDIIYSDFENNWFCNTGAVHIHHWGDLNSVIESEIKPLEGHNTKAVHCNIIKNQGIAQTCFFLRNNYPSQVYIYNNAPTQYMDLRSTTGISFLHKGVSVYVQIGDDDYRVPQHDELTLVNIPWGQFRTIGRPINLEKVNYIDFNPNRVAQGEFWIDDIIFTQGDIYPVESIKIDTIPNKYLYTKNPDLLDIPLPTPKDSTQLFLYPKFTPSDATYQSVVWSSKDPNIATIDKYGRVSAISHGQTYIYCQSVMHPEVKDSILVGVSQGGLTYQLHGVSISNQLPTTYTYNTPQAIPAPLPINDFYTFHGWHTDSITGAVVDSASFHQFGNLKAHTLYAEFTREIPGAAITILQNRILAVQNPYHYDALKEARYAWQYNNNPLASQSNFVEVGRPIPTGVYNVNIHIDQEMPISLARTIDNSTINNDDANTNFTLYPNPIKAGQLAYLIGKFDHILLFDLNGMPVETTILNDGIIKAPQETGMYILKIGVKDQTYTLKLIVI